MQRMQNILIVICTIVLSRFGPGQFNDAQQAFTSNAKLTWVPKFAYSSLDELIRQTKSCSFLRRYWTFFAHKFLYGLQFGVHVHASFNNFKDIMQGQ